MKAENIRFRYREAKNTTLEDVSFTIKKGDFVGIIGETGAGKTTLANILLGLLSPISGNLMIDSQPIDVTRISRKGFLGYVPQDISLLDDTIRRNIAFALPDEQIDEQKVWEAVKLASLEGFVLGLPEGLDTKVGEWGSRISGGQRQRIGIARALYGEPEILIMDEATSALDSKTEKAIVETLLSLRTHKTIILIAHRLTTIQFCDRLLFLENGKVSGSGTFNELRKDNIKFNYLIRHAEISGTNLDEAIPVNSEIDPPTHVKPG